MTETVSNSAGLRSNTGKPTYSFLLDFTPDAGELLLRIKPSFALAFRSFHRLFSCSGPMDESKLRLSLYTLSDLLTDDHRRGGHAGLGLAEGVNRVCVKGAVKYAPRNWQKGLSVRGCFDSAMRHLLQLNAGIEIDEELQEHHACHAAWNILAADWMVRNKPEFDDRAKHLKIETPKK